MTPGGDRAAATRRRRLRAGLCYGQVVVSQTFVPVWMPPATAPAVLKALTFSAYPEGLPGPLIARPNPVFPVAVFPTTELLAAEMPSPPFRDVTFARMTQP